MDIRVEDPRLVADLWRDKGVLLRDVEDQLKGAALVGGVCGALVG